MGPQKVVPQGTLGKRCLSTGWLSKTALRQFKPKSPCFADIWKNQLNQSMPAVCVRERVCSTSLEVFVTPVIHSLPSRPGRAVATAPCNCCHARLRRFLSCGMIFHEQSFIPEPLGQSRRPGNPALACHTPVIHVTQYGLQRSHVQVQYVPHFTGKKHVARKYL